MKYSYLSPFKVIVFLLSQLLALPTYTSAQSQSQFSNLKIQSLRAAPSRASLYEFTIQLDDTLSEAAEFVLHFPKSFNLDQLEIAGSKQIDGGLQITRKDRKVYVKRSRLGKRIPPGKQVSFVLGMIVNPNDLSLQYRIGLQVFNREGKQRSSRPHSEVVIFKHKNRGAK